MARFESFLRLLSGATVMMLLGSYGSHIAVTARSESERKRRHFDLGNKKCVLKKCRSGGVNFLSVGLSLSIELLASEMQGLACVA